MIWCSANVGLSVWEGMADRGLVMETLNLPAIRALRPAWNKGRIVGQKRPLNPKHVTETLYWGVFAMVRATSRASSCSSRVILRASAFGQHLGLDGHAWQVCFSAWYLATPFHVGPRLGSE